MTITKPVYTIKPLVWTYYEPFYCANSVLGDYYVTASEQEGYKYSGFFGMWKACDSIKHGKQLVQAEYAAQLAEALLSPSSPPEDSLSHVIWPTSTEPTSKHYTIHSENKGKGILLLQRLFPKAQADENNFCLFSTSGTGGTYQTLEAEYNEVIVKGEATMTAEYNLIGESYRLTGITFLVIHPRLVSMVCGVAYPKTEDDFSFLRLLRDTSREVLKGF